MSEKKFSYNENKMTKLLTEVSNISEFSRISGITRTNYYKILETSKNIGIETLEKLSQYFNKPISYFFDEETTPNQEYQNKIEELEKEIRALRKENENLLERLKDKEEIICLLKGDHSKNADEDQSIAM